MVAQEPGSFTLLHFGREVNKPGVFAIQRVREEERSESKRKRKREKYRETER